MEEVEVGKFILESSTGLDAIKRAPIIIEETGIKCLRIGDISNSKEYKDWGNTKVKTEDYMKAKVELGDILIARTGNTIGCNKYIDFENKKVVFNNGLIRIKVNKEKAFSKYIYYCFQTDKYRKYIESIAYGTSTQPNMKIKDLLAFKVPNFNLEIQKRIISILSSLDEKIELNRKINQNLEEIAQTLFKRWFIDFEFPNEEGKPYKSSGGKMIESELGEIPEGWKIKNLLEVGDFINGLAMQKYRPLDTEDSLKVIKIKEMNSGFSKESELCSVNIPDTYKVNFGDILFSWSGTLKVMFWNKECGGLNQHIFKVIPKNVNKLFLYFWLKIHLQTFIQIAQSKATTMGHIKRNDLNNSKIIVPNTEFWIYKEKILNSYLEKIVYQSKEIEKLIELRDYLLPKLMNGEIDVSNLKISKILNSD